jgi:putative addiction module CopG family antidote
MTVTLPADIASFVHSKVASGEFSSPDEVLRAVVRLYEKEAPRVQQEYKLRQMVQAAATQIENGESIDVDQAFDEVEVEIFGEKLTDK